MRTFHNARCARTHAAHQTRRGFRSVVDPLEARTLFSTAWESIDGTGNNPNSYLWGSAGSNLIRLAAAAYADGVSAPALAGNLSARAISNLLNNQANPANPAEDLASVDQNSLTDYGYAFGQFMDHDMDLTLDGGASM